MTLLLRISPAARRAPCLLVAVFAIGACLNPQVSDEVALKGLVLPAGTPVPSAHDDADFEKQLDDNDGVSGELPLLSAFAGGAPIHYWDFGPVSDFAAPLFVLVKADTSGALVPLDHFPIIEAVPGEPGYSPFWSVLPIEVTSSYNGELITSFAAVEEAQALGLLKSPQLPKKAINCPIVASDVSLEVGDGKPAVKPKGLFYWRGKTVRFYHLSPMPLTSDGSKSPESPMYVLSREGSEPLSEPLRGVDINGDGDTRDTNNVFPLAVADATYTPLCRRVDVSVPATGIDLIDSRPQPRNKSAIRSESELFNPGPVAGTVIAFHKTSALRNCPQQSKLGAL